MARFTGGVLTERTGREDGQNGAPASAVRDEETGKVYAFPFELSPFLLEDAFNSADKQGALADEPIGFPDGVAENGDHCWMPEHEPFTFVEAEQFVGDVLTTAFASLLNPSA